MQEAVGDKEEFLALIGEDLAGMRSQLQGLSDRVGLEGRFYSIKFNNTLRAKFFKHLPATWWRYPLKVVEPIEFKRLPKAIIAVGRKGACVGIALSRQYNLPLIQIQDPTFAYSCFDLILAPEHDGLKTANSISLKTALHPYTKNKIASLKIVDYERSRLGVLLGGSNGRFKLEPQDAERIAQEVASFIKQKNVFAEILPSRRTSKGFIAALDEKLASFSEIKERYRLYKMDEIIGDNNPYSRIIVNSHYLAVTQDSVSMISEACAQDAEVFIISMRGQSRRLEVFLKSLLDIHRVRWFKPTSNQDGREAGDNLQNARKPLDDGEKASQSVKMLLGINK